MTRSFRACMAGLLPLALGTLLLTACEDPSGVGLTVLDPGDTDPRARVYPAEAVLAPLRDDTGLPVLAVGSRAYAGRAEDPVFGELEATGYMDFALPASPPSEYFTTSVQRVILRLRPDYRYGQEEGPTAYDLYEVSARWDATVLPSDTTLQVFDRRLTSFNVAPGDTLVDVELPRDWVIERDSLLRATTFNDGFHGLQLRPRPESRAALGFDGAFSSLLVVADREAAPDTVQLGASQVFSEVRRDLAGAAPPPQLFPLQDGTGTGLRLAFDLGEVSTPPAITAAFVRLNADTTLAAAGPAGFVRPLARTLSLYGLRGTEAPVELAQAVLNARTQTYVFASGALSREFQQSVLGRGRFSAFAVGFPRTLSTLSVAPVVTSDGAEPRLVLLVAPTD